MGTKFINQTPFILKNKKNLKKLIESVINYEDNTLESLTYIFCTDDFLINLNKKHLNHDYYTDILTFNLSNIRRVINAEIYISIERVKYNSALFNCLFINELYRVMIHGILHLCGYNDKSKSGKIRMTQKENFYLSLIDDCFT